jgi:hypothetical protein
MIGDGILALWNDCEASHEDAYEAWYQGEHLAERRAVPGFRRGRRMQSLADSPGYFTYYETVGPDVLFSLVYRQLLDHLSPETERIMRETFRNMSRTVCRVARRDGAVYGGYAVTVKLVDQEVDGPVWLFVDGLADRSDVARTEIWTAVEPPKGAISREETLRGGMTRLQHACWSKPFARGRRWTLSIRRESSWQPLPARLASIVCCVICNPMADQLVKKMTPPVYLHRSAKFVGIRGSLGERS